MFRHSIIFHPFLGRKTIVRYRFKCLSVMSKHLMNNIIALAIRFILLRFWDICVGIHCFIRTWSRSKTLVVNGLSLAKPLFLTSETWCASEMVDFDEDNLVWFLICLICRFYNGAGDLILPNTGNAIVEVLLLWFELYFLIYFLAAFFESIELEVIRNILSRLGGLTIRKARFMLVFLSEVNWSKGTCVQLLLVISVHFYWVLLII
jgi:hypothetical protein